MCYEKVLENFLWIAGKVLDFLVSKSMGTLCLSVSMLCMICV